MALPGGTFKLWVYSTTDAAATVDADGYFTNGQTLGMSVNDLVIVIDTATPLVTMHRVTSLSLTDKSVDLSNGTTIGATTDSD
jgi:hypothetical protein